MITELKSNLNIIYDETKNVLTPENIVEGVTILGVTGTFKSYKEYIELEYVQGTGTQYIDTGIIGDSNKKVTFRFSTTDTATGCPMGCWSQNNCIMMEFGSDVVVYYNNTGNLVTYPTKQTNTEYILELSGSLTKVTRGDGTVLINKSQSGSFSASTTMYLFARHINRDGENKPNNISPIKFYSCQIWDGNTLVRDFIPVTRKSDSKVCVYDKVEKKFYENKGSGDFIARLY